MLIAPHTIPHQTTPVERHGKVLKLLLKGMFTTAEIAFETDLSHADAARAVHELSEKDYLRSDGIIDGNTGFTKKKHYLTKQGRRAALGLPSNGDDVMAKPQQRQSFPPNRALAAGLHHINGVAGKFDFSKIEKKLHGTRGLTYSGTCAEWRDAKEIATALNLKEPNSTIFNNLTELVKLGLLESEEREYDRPGMTRTNRRRCYRRVELTHPVMVEDDEEQEQHTPPVQAAQPQPPAAPQPSSPPAAPQTAWSRDDLERVLDQFDPMDVLMAALARLEKEVKDHRTFAAAVAKLQVPK